MTNSKWNSIIVDETPSECQLLKTMLMTHCPQVKVLAEVSEVGEAIACIKKLGVNLIFCNVLLHDGDVFEVIDQLNGFQAHFIILASDKGFALRAFRYKAFDYILKPISMEVLLDLMERLESEPLGQATQNEVLDLHSQRQKFATIILNAGGLQHVVHITDIIHLEGDGNYSTVHLATGDKILVSKSLKHFEEVLPARNFYRVHQSHIVNLTYVKSVQNGEVHLINLSNGETAPLARRKKDPFFMRLAKL